MRLCLVRARTLITAADCPAAIYVNCRVNKTTLREDKIDEIDRRDTYM